MEKIQGQFQIIVLESEFETSSHSLPGPLGVGVTSSVPGWISDSVVGDEIVIQILPRPNKQDVDPSTLKSS